MIHYNETKSFDLKVSISAIGERNQVEKVET